jgi:hypothetical protein
MAVLIVGLPAVSGADAYGLGVTTVPTTICGHNDHLLVHNPGAKFYQIRDAYWRGIGPTCIRSLGEVAGFRVTRTAKPLNGLSYPNIMRGCIWNICTPGDELPVKLSNLRSANSTWHTTERAGGRWNATYDMWFDKNRITRGHASGAELMIWLNHQGGCCILWRNASKYWIDGRQWYLQWWRAYDPEYNLHWNYIQFRAVHPTWRVDHLDLKPFVRISENHRLINPDWWMEQVQAVFEIWNGGVGLTTTNFSVHVNGW